MNATLQSHTINSKRRTVLLVGDSLGILKRIAFALQRRGHSVIWAGTGETGLRVAEGEAPHLIVSEIDLPDISGYEICQMIKGSFFFDIPVVLVGRSGEEGREAPRAYKSGADDYFASFSNSQFVLAKLDGLAQGTGVTPIGTESVAGIELSEAAHAVPNIDLLNRIRFE